MQKSPITGEQFKHVALQSMGEKISKTTEYFHCLIKTNCHFHDKNCHEHDEGLDEVQKRP